MPESSIDAYKANEKWNKFKDIINLDTPASGIGVNADNVEINGLYYNLIGKGLVAEVTSNPNKYSGDVIIPEKITYEDKEYTVTSIGSSTFSFCSSLTSVVMPNTVTSIGGSAFERCSNLSSVTMSSKLESIGHSAFVQCSSLTSITIPGTVTFIGQWAFENCKSLSSVYITDLDAWCKISFYDGQSNPLCCGGNLFINNEKATNIVIPNSVTTISSYAFYGFKTMLTLTIAESVTSIGESAFYGCSGLSTLVIPNSVTTINNLAFYACSGLSSLTISNQLSNIDVSVFNGCSSLTSVAIPNSVQEIERYAFAGCSNLSLATIGTGVSRIWECAFKDCGSLADIYCHREYVPRLDDNVFENSFQEYITLHVPESSIDAYKANEKWNKFKEIIGFTGEPSQVVEVVTLDGEVIKTEITITIVDEDTKTAVVTAASIPASETGSTEIAIPAVVNGYTITSIDDNAFKGMTGVTDIYLPETDQPLNLGENALKIDDEHVATVHVPVGLLGSYAFNDQLAQNFNEGKVKATVTAPNRYWTFSAGVDVVVPEGVGVYICKYDSEDKVIITELDDSQLLVNGKRIIKANNGVLVACNNGTGGDAYDIVANPGEQSSMASASYDAKSYGDDNMLEPVIVSKNYPATSYYVLKNGEFHKILANSSKMPAGKAVLRLPGVSNVRILSIIGGDDDTTGIYNRPIIEEESKWFDLQGRRIERPVKAGLYIKNGKKVVIK